MDTKLQSYLENSMVLNAQKFLFAIKSNGLRCSVRLSSWKIFLNKSWKERWAFRKIYSGPRKNT